MLALIPIALMMLVFPGDVIAAAQEACALFAKSVLPGLFPFLTVMLLITGRLPEKAKAVPMALMGILSGSPAGARLSGYGTFTRRQYRLFAHATAVMSPMFILGTLPNWLSGHGPLLFIASVLSALITALLSYIMPMKNGSERVTGDAAKGEALSLSEAVNRAAQTMLTVCGCMVVGSCLSMLVFKFVPIASPLVRALTQGVMEVTKGCKDISDIAFSHPITAPALCAMLISFGGVSLWLQNYAFYIKGVLPLGPYFMLKIFHAGCAYVLCIVFAPLFSLQAAPTAAILTTRPQPIVLFIWAGAFFLSEIMLQWRRKSKGD